MTSRYRKTVYVNAILFDGENGTEVIEWIRKHSHHRVSENSLLDSWIYFDNINLVILENYYVYIVESTNEIGAMEKADFENEYWPI